MPPTKLERSRCTGPGELELREPRARSLNTTSSSRRARCAPGAEVLADAEGEVAVRVAVDPELERILEHLLVAVRRRIEEHRCSPVRIFWPRSSTSSVAVRRSG